MQKFSYHTHSTNSDGKNTPMEMIKQVEELGWDSIGISDHFHYHPLNQKDLPWDTSAIKEAIDYWKRSYDKVQEAAIQSKIKVLFGFEVDFYQSAKWRQDFEKIISVCPYDYLLTSTHYLRSKDETNRLSLFYTQAGEVYPDELLDSFWETTKEAIKSGYFNFIGHIDLFEQRHIAKRSYEDEKHEVFELLKKHNVFVELNTGGARHGKDFYPTIEFLKQMLPYHIPLMISDDAHKVSELGGHFERAEKFLVDIGYQNRINLLDKIKISK